MSVTALDAASIPCSRSSSPCCETAFDEMMHSVPTSLQYEAFCQPSVENLCIDDCDSESMHFEIENYSMENLTSEAAEINSVESSNLSFQSGTCDDDIFRYVHLDEPPSAYVSERVKEILLDMQEYVPYRLPLPEAGSYYTTVFIEEDTSFPEEDSSSQTIDDAVVVIPPTTSEESLTPSGGSFVKLVVGAVISVITFLMTGFAIYRFAS